MTETAIYGNYKIIFTIAGSSLLLSSRIDFLATIVKCFQLEIIARKSSILVAGGNQDPPLFTIFHLVQPTVIQFNLIAVYGISCLTVIVKSYLNRVSLAYIACQRMSKFELSAIKIKGFQCKAIATQSSILDIVGIPNPPSITIFGKVSFNLTQATTISFNLIVIYRKSYLYGNYELIFYQRRIYTPACV